jgi:hypothetical protein
LFQGLGLFEFDGVQQYAVTALWDIAKAIGKAHLLKTTRFDGAEVRTHGRKVGAPVVRASCAGFEYRMGVGPELRGLPFVHPRQQSIDSRLRGYALLGGALIVGYRWDGGGERRSLSA